MAFSTCSPAMFGPDTTIGVEENVLRAVVAEKREDLAAQFPFQFSFEPLMVFIMDNREVSHVPPSEIRVHF